VYDFLIIGGGISGLTIARTLSSNGFSTAICEAGSLQNNPDYSTDQFWTYQSSGDDYSWQRVRCIGGRAELWGGHLAMPTEDDFKNWPISIEDLRPYLERTTALLQAKIVGKSKQHTVYLGEEEYQLKPKWMATHSEKRPLLGSDLIEGIEILENTRIEKLLIDGKKVIGVRAVDRREILAREVILCASPFENIRLLGKSGLSELKGLGEGIQDHYVASYLLLHNQKTLDPEKNFHRSQVTNSRAGFWFELNGPYPLIDIEEEFLEELEISPKEAQSMSYHVVHGFGETDSKGKRKVYFRECLKIDWNWTEKDLENHEKLKAACMDLVQTVATEDCELVPFRDPVQMQAVPHESGGCCLGVVTDLYGRFNEVEGLSVGDASLMPSSLACYPTLTFLALGQRLADSLMDEKKS